MSYLAPRNCESKYCKSILINHINTIRALAQSKDNYKKVYPFLKWILAIGSLAFFVYQWQHTDIQSWYAVRLKLQEHIWTFTAVLILMLVNWSLEAQKFRILIKSRIDLSLTKALFTVLAGTTISNFTPARTGDYIGRSVMLKSVHPIRVILATITSNIFQLITTYSLGIICFIFLLISGSLPQGIMDYKEQIYTAGLILFLVLVLIAVLPKWVLMVKDKLPKALKKGIQMILHYDRKIVFRIQVLSLLRYATFSFQFYLLLTIFSAESLPFQLITLIPIAYLLQSLVPVPAISDIGVRVAFTTLLFSTLMDTREILFAVSSLWFINLILPALLGSIYLLSSLFSSK